MLTKVNPDRTYQGWTNYETWCVNRWLTGYSDPAGHWSGLAAKLAASLAVNEDVLKYHVGDALKDEFEESNPLADASNVWADLLNSALSAVNWSEIAEHMLEENTNL